MPADTQRIVILNWMVSKSVAKDVEGHEPPTHGAAELLSIIKSNLHTAAGVEYVGATETERADPGIKKSSNYDRMRLRSFKEEKGANGSYIVLLIEFIDKGVKGINVVDWDTYTGREISGGESERGAHTAHVLVRVPGPDSEDVGSYRCVIEAGTAVSRKDIESFLRRQLRRRAKDENWTFPVHRKNKKGKNVSDGFRYHSRLDLLSDVSRAFNPLAISGREISYMLFTNRAEKRSTAQEVDVVQREFTADVSIKVYAKEGPQEPDKKKNWLLDVMDYFKSQGYTTRTFYKGGERRDRCRRGASVHGVRGRPLHVPERGCRA